MQPSTFPFTINQPSINLEQLANMRDILRDSAEAMLDNPHGEKTNWELFHHALACRQAIIDADGLDGTFGTQANAMMEDIFATMASACKVPA